MERILGVGGVFFKARDPQALAAWYERHLGLPIEAGQTHGMLTAAAPGEATVWSAFPDDTPYFGTGPSPFMLNYRVRNLDAMLAQLRAAGRAWRSGSRITTTGASGGPTTLKATASSCGSRVRCGRRTDRADLSQR